MAGLRGCVSSIMKNNRKIETKIYELLGIKQFRKAVFKLEKIIHRKDNGKNTNYHIQSNTVDSIGEFKKYLYYNGAIHTSNLIKGIPLLTLMYLFNLRVLPIALLSVLLIKDAYCVMLQRYNWIKLSEKEKLLKERQEKKILNNYNQYSKQLLCDLKENKVINYQYDYSKNMTGKIEVDNSTQMREKGKTRIRKMEVKENE